MTLKELELLDEIKKVVEAQDKIAEVLNQLLEVQRVQLEILNNIRLGL